MNSSVVKYPWTSILKAKKERTDFLCRIHEHQGLKSLELVREPAAFDYLENQSRGFGRCFPDDPRERVGGRVR